jgi:transcription initiation factor TFIID TATA-box-binding protein
MSKIGLLKSLKPKTALQIRNIVATVNTKLSINLDQLKSKNPREASYVPEVFPGLIFKMKNYKATFLVFSNGKIVINGVQTEAQATTYFRAFFKILKKFKTRGPATKTN